METVLQFLAEKWWVILAALAGIWVGYRDGCRGRYAIYFTGGVMLAFVGTEIIIRYL
jgi:hypothetical protein